MSKRLKVWLCLVAAILAGQIAMGLFAATQSITNPHKDLAEDLFAGWTIGGIVAVTVIGLVGVAAER